MDFVIQKVMVLSQNGTYTFTLKDEHFFFFSALFKQPPPE